MAQKESKYPQNSPGPYYVDDQCIACDACVVEAPSFFRMNDLVGHAFVFNQPKSAIDTQLCENALEACPVNAIGRDGDK